MKKVYSLILFSFVLIALNPAQLKAQLLCPGTTPRANTLSIGGGVCVVFAERLWPNSTAILLDVNLEVIGTAPTDAEGFVSIVYDCNRAPFRLSTCTLDGCCNVFVPPAAILPVKLVNFNAQLARTNSVVLNWSSVVELTSYKYVVQKSEDGKNFNDIGELSAAGNSNKTIKYNFTDNNFNGSVSYFRLKQVDIDGKFEYSRTVYVNNKKSINLSVASVSPNPFTSDVQIIGISASEVNYKNIKVFNSFGQFVNYRITGTNSVAIDASAPRGVYLLRVKDQTIKLVKN